MPASDLFATGRPAEYGRIYPADEEWLARRAPEPVIDPELPVVDAHHHLWQLGGMTYLADDLGSDLSTGHRVESTVYVDCGSNYRTTGPLELRPVGETEFVVRETAGHPGMAAGIVAFADLQRGRAVEEVLQAHTEAGRG